MLVEWPERPPCDQQIAYWEDSLRAFVSGIKMVRDWTLPTIYLELGSFCGTSALFLANLSKSASIVCIDAWDGRGSEQYKPLSNRSLELFQANLWNHRDRVMMIRNDTLTGMKIAAESGVIPDVIFVDADHSPDAVKQDILLAKSLWPCAVICGDDFDETSKAVLEVFGAGVGVVGLKFWWEIRDFHDSITLACCSS